MPRIIGTIGATLAVVAAVAASATPASAGGQGHAGGVNVGMADGSVRFIRDSTLSIQTWRALGTRAGGEVLSSDY
jgi:prepilin-type processing-associated H-X9-DG protein